MQVANESNFSPLLDAIAEKKTKLKDNDSHIEIFKQCLVVILSNIIHQLELSQISYSGSDPFILGLLQEVQPNEHLSFPRKLHDPSYKVVLRALQLTFHTDHCKIKFPQGIESFSLLPTLGGKKNGSIPSASQPTQDNEEIRASVMQKEDILGMITFYAKFFSSIVVFPLIFVMFPMGFLFMANGFVFNSSFFLCLFSVFFASSMLAHYCTHKKIDFFGKSGLDKVNKAAKIEDKIAVVLINLFFFLINFLTIPFRLDKKGLLVFIPTFTVLSLGLLYFSNISITAASYTLAIFFMTMLFLPFIYYARNEFTSILMGALGVVILFTSPFYSLGFSVSNMLITACLIATVSILSRVCYYYVSEEKNIYENIKVNSLVVINLFLGLLLVVVPCYIAPSLISILPSFPYNANIGIISFSIFTGVVIFMAFVYNLFYRKQENTLPKSKKITLEDLYKSDIGDVAPLLSHIAASQKPENSPLI